MGIIKFLGADMNHSFSSNIRGRVRNFSLPKNYPLVPLYEAVVNAINAIDERTNTGDSFRGNIRIEVLRDHNAISESDPETVRGFSVVDNGIGFDEANMVSFMVADSDHKAKIGGKGVGRFSWLKAFASAEITSTYKDDGVFLTRRFSFNLNQEGIEDTLQDEHEIRDYRTEVLLDEYLPGYKENAPKRLETIASRIVQHCFVYFLRSDCPSIEIFDGSDCLRLNDMFRDIFMSSEHDSFAVRGKEFNLLNVKVNDKAFSQKNRLILCANERQVDSKDLEKLVVNLGSDIFDREGYWYFGILTGDFLDRNVDMSRLSFSIPYDRGAIDVDEPSLGEIIDAAKEHIETYLKEYLDETEKQKSKRIEDYTEKVAPQYRHLKYYVPDELAMIKPGLSDNELDDELFKLKRKLENQTKEDCSSLLDKVKNDRISSDEYREQFDSVVKKVTDVNSSVLADYVAHRRVVLNLFSCALSAADDGKYSRESKIHQLLYPMGATSNEISYENHNLWLIDERLSYCRYIASDKAMNNAPNRQRPDILVLDSPVAVTSEDNNGTAYGSISIFEIKRPMRDDYDMEHNPITQLFDYAEKIRDGKAFDRNGRKIVTHEDTQFYLFALCDITPTLERVMKKMSFFRTGDNLGAYSYNNNLRTYTEIISFDKLKNDAEKRNRVLFDVLGV